MCLENSFAFGYKDSWVLYSHSRLKYRWRFDRDKYQHQEPANESDMSLRHRQPISNLVGEWRAVLDLNIHWRTVKRRRFVSIKWFRWKHTQSGKRLIVLDCKVSWLAFYEGSVRVDSLHVDSVIIGWIQRQRWEWVWIIQFTLAFQSK